MKPTIPSDLEIDFREREGFQIGKAAALAESAFRREQRDFRKLCARLYSRNWQRKRRREQPERVRENQRRWRRANSATVRAKDRAYRAKRRKPIRLTCQNRDCGRTFSPKRYRTAKYCSHTCRNHVHGVARAKKKNRGIRNMQIGPTLLSVLAAAPPGGLALREIVSRAPGVKRGSCATLLSAWAQKGTVDRVSGRYSLPVKETGT